MRASGGAQPLVWSTMPLGLWRRCSVSLGRFPGGWGGHVHDPIMWARGHFPEVHSYCLVSRESIKASDCQLGGRVSEVITSDVGMSPDFMQGGVVPR